MNMNMKNEKTMLALILVAALAMVSVAGVALASENSDAIIITPTKTIVGADETYEGPLSVAAYGETDATSVLIINGTYTGTVSFYNVDPESEDAEPFATVVCNAVSGVTFTNTYTVDTTTSTVTVDGTQTGTVTLISGAITLGYTNTVGEDTSYYPYMGTLTVSTYGTIVSGATYGATVTIVPASGTVAEYVTVSGDVKSGITIFESAYKGITNEMIGNAITITKDTDDTNTYDYTVTGTLAKIDIDGASAIGTVLNAAYGVIFNGAFHVATVDPTTGAISIAGIDVKYDISGLTTVDASTGYVTGINGALELNLDATISGSVVATATIINNNDLKVTGAAITVTGIFINNGDMQVKTSTLAGAGEIINYGTFTIDAQASGCPNLSGYYVETTPTTGAISVKGYATLADAVAAATGTTDVIVAGGYVYNTEDVTIASTQTIKFQGAGTNALFALDKTGSLTIAGTANNLTAVSMIIASEASMDLSSTTKIIENSASTDAVIDVNGSIIVKNALITDSSKPQSITYFGTISAETKTISTTTTTFNNLYIALTTTTTGTITLLENAKLNKSATLADGVTFDNAGFGLTIVEDVVLTADGHFQFTYYYINSAGTDPILAVNGDLIINDSTTPVTTGTVAGSFIGANTAMYLNGTFTINEGAIFTNAGYIFGYVPAAGVTTPVETGTILVAGTFNNTAEVKSLALLGITGTFNNSNDVEITKMVVVTGTFNNFVGTTFGFVGAETLIVTGTFNNSDGTTTGCVNAEDLSITGTFKAGKWADNGDYDDKGVVITGILLVGNAPTGFPYTNSAVITGQLVLTSAAYAIVYGEASEDYEVVALDASAVADAAVTTFYIGDDVYAVEYAGSASIVLNLLTVDFSGKKLVGWYTAPDFSGSMITVNDKVFVGKYVAVYGNLVDKTVTVSFAYTQNGTWVLDGQNIGASGNITLAVGTHTIAFVADNGYELSNYAVTVNQVTISSTSYNFQNDTNAVAYSGEVKEKSTDGGLDLVTILLIIITIVIIIMAIIIALKLMRS